MNMEIMETIGRRLGNLLMFSFELITDWCTNWMQQLNWIIAFIYSQLILLLYMFGK